MSNRTRKVISILCVLALLCTLLPGAALAKSEKSRDKTAKSSTPQISVGGGAMYLSFDGGVTSSVWLSAGSSGTVELTLSLSEDCGLSVSLNGGGVGLTVEEDLVRTCRYNVVAGQSYLLEITPNRNVTIGVRADKWTDSLEADPEAPAGEEADQEQESPAVAGQDDPSGETPTEADSDGQTGENPENSAENDPDSQSGDNPEDASGETTGEELPQETSEGDADSTSAETETTYDPQETASETGEGSQEATGDQADQPSSNEELPDQEEPQDSSEESQESHENQYPEGATDQGSDEEQPSEGQETESSASNTNQTEVQSEIENHPESGEGMLIVAQEGEEVPAEMQEPSEAALIETIAEHPAQEDSEEEGDLAVQTEGTDGKLIPEEETEIPVPEQNETEENEPSPQQEHSFSQENGTPSQTELAEPQTETEPQAPAESQSDTEPQTLVDPQAEAESQTAAQSQTEAESQTPSEPQSEAEPQGQSEPQNQTPAAEEILPADRSATFEVTFDTDAPTFGDTAHFRAVLQGYDEVDYSLQWQYSLDDENWEDIPEATEPEMDLTVTRENHLYFWRIMVYVHLPESEP